MIVVNGYFDEIDFNNVSMYFFLLEFFRVSNSLKGVFFFSAYAMACVDF